MIVITQIFSASHSDNMSTSFESIMLQNGIDEGTVVVSYSSDIALDCQGSYDVTGTDMLQFSMSHLMFQFIPVEGNSNFLSDSFCCGLLKLEVYACI